MMYLFKSIHHYLTSNSRHGTHSPFVYALADQAIYCRSDHETLAVHYPESFVVPYQSILDRILTHWQIDRLSMDVREDNFPAYWIGKLGEGGTTRLQELLKSGKILFIDSPHRKKNEQAWKKLIERPEVIVSIDLFYFGIALNRSGQRKEHFKLRYKK